MVGPGGASSPSMSADDAVNTSPILRPLAEPTWSAAGKLALFGAGLGLVYVATLFINDQTKAYSVSPVFAKARTLLLFYQAEKGAWPKDFDLNRAEAALPGFNLAALNEALAQCELPGTWTFVTQTPEGWPAVVFTPAEGGAPFERTLGVVDGWVDDGNLASGDLRVRADVAQFKLTAE